MSERGSFVTEFIYCDGCLNAAKSVLLEGSEQVIAAQVPGMPIIAGRVKSGYPRGEIELFEHSINEKLSAVICHSLRIAVLAEVGQEIFTIAPGD